MVSKKFIFFLLGITLISFIRSNRTFTKQANGRGKIQSFEFYLNKSSITSAGIYNSDSVLVKTLWTQVKYSAGAHTGSWDGINDDSNAVTVGIYTWKVLANDVQYKWEGVIGNTSDSLTGITKHKGITPIATLCFAGSKAFYGTYYNEQVTNTYLFDTSYIQERSAIDQIPYGVAPGIIRNVTDGNYVYWAGYDAFNRFRSSFVYATKVSDNSLPTFSGGIKYSVTYGPPTQSLSVLSLRQDTMGITDLAVQKRGIYLLIVRPKKDSVYVLDKKTGNEINHLGLIKPSFVKLDTSNNQVWIANATIATKYRIEDGGKLVATKISITCNQPIVAMDVNPKNNNLAICEGGNSQVIKFYSSGGTLLSTFGQTGGYLTNAHVSDNKFYWNDARGTYPTFVSYAPNGSFWVGDWGNGRIQHYDSKGNFISRIMWLPAFYNIGVDYGNTSRMFADGREFRIDYKKINSKIQQSWKLVNNWMGDIQTSQYNQFFGLLNPTTFPNGHTFCFVVHDANNFQLVELKSDGTKSFSDILIPQIYRIDEDFNLNQQTRTLPGRPIIWTRKVFTNNYTNNIPVWKKADTIQISPIQKTANDAGFSGQKETYQPAAITSDSMFVAFNAGTNTGYHLGGIKHGKWIFKTAKAIDKSYSGDFPSGEKYDIGNHVQYAGNVCISMASTVIWGYHGEFWKGSQTNMYTHVNSDGLTINQFGAAIPLSGNTRGYNCYAGDAGNVYSVYAVPYNGDYYIFHNDESIHGGIGVWKITALNTIYSITGRF